MEDNKSKIIRRAYSGAQWESKVGYCRAIRVGNIIAVTGTIALDEAGNNFAPGDAYAQTQRCLSIIEKALNDLKTSRTDIIRTRMFVTDIKRWNEYGRAHGEFFKDHPPATSMIEVKGLINSESLIEIEVDAVASDESVCNNRTLKGMIIEESLVDSRILNHFKIINLKITDQENPAERWHINTVEVDENELSEKISILKFFLRPGKWYMHFWDHEKLIVIFREKTFHFKHSDLNGRDEAVTYGVSLGIPTKQLDFEILKYIV